MALFELENFAFGTVAASFNNSQTTLSMSTGVTARFTKFPTRAILYNSTDYATAHEAYIAGDLEVIGITSKSGDTFDVITRGLEGTSAISSTAGATYVVAVVATKGQWDKVILLTPAFVLIKETQTTGTNGGDFNTGAWQTRVLNDKETDTLGLAALSSNQITLTAGTYLVTARCPAFSVDSHRARLRNTTAGTTLLLSDSGYAPSGGGVDWLTMHGLITVAANQALELQHRCQTTKATNGFGVATSIDSQDETYSTILFTRASIDP